MHFRSTNGRAKQENLRLVIWKMAVRNSLSKRLGLIVPQREGVHLNVI